MALSINNKDSKKLLTQAVILAGGRGERLRPLTDTIPKPMAPINGIPFMDYLIYSIIKTGINKILILLGYKSKLIVDRYKSMKGIKIEFSYGTENDETGRRLLNAHKQLDDFFLLLYGDNFWPIEISSICENYKKLDVAVTTTVFSNKNGQGEYGYENNVVVSDNNYLIKYDKKRATKKANGVDIGYFLIAKDILNPRASGNISFEIDILPKFIANKQLGAYITDAQYYYLTNNKSLKDFEFATVTKNFSPLPQKYFME